LGEEGRAKAGVTDGMIRLSLGLESAADLERDVARGLAAAAAVG
jgi:O-succinylhomoserine sulfhydrylase